MLLMSSVAMKSQAVFRQSHRFSYLDTVASAALSKNPGPHGLSPQPIIHDTPKVEFPQVKLSEPPNYKLGEKVCNYVSFMQ